MFVVVTHVADTIWSGFRPSAVSVTVIVDTLGIVGIAPQSLISFHVAQSNTAKCQSVALEGPTTSQLPPPQPHVVVH